ncbi:MAG: hypothetical protein ABWZ03_01210, partial [Solirubrobacterales bacterium]
DADPTFHVWVSDWWDEKRKEAVEERTREWYRWAIQGHLLPYWMELAGLEPATSWVRSKALTT